MFFESTAYIPIMGSSSLYICNDVPNHELLISLFGLQDFVVALYQYVIDGSWQNRPIHHGFAGIALHIYVVSHCISSCHFPYERSIPYQASNFFHIPALNKHAKKR